VKTKIFVALFFLINFFFISTEQISKNDLISQITISQDTKNWDQNFKNKLYQGKGKILSNNNKEIFIKIYVKEYPIFLRLVINQLSRKNKIQLQKLIGKNITFKAQLKRYENNKNIFNGELLFFY
jgi:hypothetical protein